MAVIQSCSLAPADSPVYVVDMLYSLIRVTCIAILLIAFASCEKDATFGETPVDRVASPAAARQWPHDILGSLIVWEQRFGLTDSIVRSGGRFAWGERIDGYLSGTPAIWSSTPIRDSEQRVVGVLLTSGRPDALATALLDETWLRSADRDDPSQNMRFVRQLFDFFEYGELPTAPDRDSSAVVARTPCTGSKGNWEEVCGYVDDDSGDAASISYSDVQRYMSGSYGGNRMNWDNMTWSELNAMGGRARNPDGSIVKDQATQGHFADYLDDRGDLVSATGYQGDILEGERGAVSGHTRVCFDVFVKCGELPPDFEIVFGQSGGGGGNTAPPADDFDPTDSQSWSDDHARITLCQSIAAGEVNDTDTDTGNGGYPDEEMCNKYLANVERCGLEGTAESDQRDAWAKLLEYDRWRSGIFDEWLSLSATYCTPAETIDGFICTEIGSITGGRCYRESVDPLDDEVEDCLGYHSPAASLLRGEIERNARSYDCDGQPVEDMINERAESVCSASADRQLGVAHALIADLPLEEYFPFELPTGNVVVDNLDVDLPPAPYAASDLGSRSLEMVCAPGSATHAQLRALLAEQIDAELASIGESWPATPAFFDDTFFQILLEILEETVPELIPGVDTYLELRRAVESYTEGNYYDSSFYFAGAILTVTPVDKFKDLLRVFKAGRKGITIVRLYDRLRRLDYGAAKGFKSTVVGEMKNTHIFFKKKGHWPDLKPLTETFGGKENLIYTVYDRAFQDGIFDTLITGRPSQFNLLIDGYHIRGNIIKLSDGSIRIDDFWIP